MKSKLQKIALIAEIVSAVAIVLSLIFVGLQVRIAARETEANSIAIQGSVRQAMLDADLRLILATLDHPYLSKPVNYALNDEQTERLKVWFIAYTRTRESYWRQYSNGLIDPDTYESFMRSYIGYIAFRQENRTAWAFIAKAGIVSEDFIEDVEKRLAHQ